MRALSIPIVLAVLAGALVVGFRLGGDPTPPADAPSSTPGPRPSATSSVRTVEDLLARARPDEEGNVELAVTPQELTAVANSELPGDSPVRAVELDLRSSAPDGGSPEGGPPDDRPPDDRPRVDFRADVREPDIEVTGEVALDVRDGRVLPELLDVRAGVLPLPGPLRSPVQDVVDDAARLFAELSDRGVDITDLEIRNGQLHIAGRVAPGTSLPGAPTPAD